MIGNLSSSMSKVMPVVAFFTRVSKSDGGGRMKDNVLTGGELATNRSQRPQTEELTREPDMYVIYVIFLQQMRQIIMITMTFLYAQDSIS